MNASLESLYRPVCDLLECRYPLSVLAGVGEDARSEWIAAAAEAGAFGFLGMAQESPARIAEEVSRVCERTRRSFGVHLMAAATDAALLDRQIGTCIDLRVPVVGLFGDSPASVIQRLRDANTLVVCQVGSAGQAREAQRAGAQIVIAQGKEAGGDRALQDLLPELLAAVSIPVLGAGGWADGNDVANMLGMGAQGAVLDTAFIAARASSASERLQKIAMDAADAMFVRTEAPIERIERSSPVCYADEFAEVYFDRAGRDEVLASLNELLEAERAGARVAMRLVAEARDGETRQLAEGIRRDEVKWCGVLIRAIQSMQAVPSTRTGAFYDKVMAIDGLPARMAFLNRGQAWVVRKLRSLVPRLAEGRTQNELAEMLAAHEENIARVAGFLGGPG